MLQCQLCRRSYVGFFFQARLLFLYFRKQCLSLERLCVLIKTLSWSLLHVLYKGPLPRALPRPLDRKSVV